MEDQPLHRSRRLHNILSLIVEPPSPPLRGRVKMIGSFESTNVSESPRERELRYT